MVFAWYAKWINDLHALPTAVIITTCAMKMPLS